MAFDAPPFARALHIFAAVLWAGAGIFMAFILGPSLRKAGPAAGPLMMVAMRRGGFAWYFLSLGAITILTGGYMFSEFGYAMDPFGSGRTIMITLGAIIAVLAYLHAVSTIAIKEAKFRKLVKSIPEGTPPTPQQAAQMGVFGAYIGKHSAMSQAMVLVALILMVGSRLA